VLVPSRKQWASLETYPIHYFYSESTATPYHNGPCGSDRRRTIHATVVNRCMCCRLRGSVRSEVSRLTARWAASLSGSLLLGICKSVLLLSRYTLCWSSRLLCSWWPFYAC